ncbi:hypothetical protein [Candidatus Uabimicrobium amorphum]|uniref:Uncharacterized protein n=1 Tax=Uabimicrobium amorphum TaxID=2596890 RepID=A0A5S9ITQ5_UABAM|nr:hypothetical protein [Candidatus Uabimicrobium amorphum]BBM86970.1 hypothetical protein UABAM_05372 [Candidatus Uabimicrobium amorphum]
MKVEFSSGYTTDISNTKDYDIKEFPAQVLPQIRESLNAFLKEQSFLQAQNSKIEIDAVLLWGCDAKKNINFWLPACLDHDVTDHAGRKTFRLTGSLVVKRNNPVASWNIIILSSQRKDQIQQWIASSNFLQIDPQVRHWTEFSLAYNKQNLEVKALNNKHVKFMAITTLLVIALVFGVFHLYRKNQQLQLLSQQNQAQVAQLQQKNRQQQDNMAAQQQLLKNAVREVLSKKLRASQGIRAWVHGRYPVIEQVFHKLAAEDMFDDGLQMFLEIADSDQSLREWLNNYEPGFVYDAQNNSVETNVKQKIISEGKVNQYKAIAYYVGVLQLYKNFINSNSNIKDKR